MAPGTLVVRHVVGNSLMRPWLSLLSHPELRSLGPLVPIPTSIHLESGRRVLRCTVGASSCDGGC